MLCRTESQIHQTRIDNCFGRLTPVGDHRPSRCNQSRGRHRWKVLVIVIWSWPRSGLGWVIIETLVMSPRESWGCYV